QILTHNARHDIGWAGSERHDPTHRARQIGLRPSERRNGGKRGSTRRPMQKKPTEKVYRGYSLSRSCYSITSSARASTDAGRSRPSALAVLRLIVNSYLVGACTGRSAGFSPLSMRLT